MGKNGLQRDIEGGASSPLRKKRRLCEGEISAPGSPSTSVNDGSKSSERRSADAGSDTRVKTSSRRSSAGSESDKKLTILSNSPGIPRKKNDPSAASSLNSVAIKKKMTSPTTIEEADIPVPKSPIEDLRVERVFACRLRGSDGLSEKQKRKIQNDANGVPGSFGEALRRFPYEYLVQWRDWSYRELMWVDYAHLIFIHDGEAKLAVFHRRNAELYLPESDGEVADKLAFTANGGWRVPRQEIPLSDQEEGNLGLFCLCDRVISVRQRKHKGVTQKEYLVKWNMQGYAESTWIAASRFGDAFDSGVEAIDSEVEVFLKLPDFYARYIPESYRERWTARDVEAIRQFERFNRMTEFPIFVPTPGSAMASSPSLTKKVKSKVIDDEPDAPAASAAASNLPSEANDGLSSYDFTPNVSKLKEDASKHWKSFLGSKLGRQGQYLPSETSSGEFRSLMVHQQDALQWLFHNWEIAHHGSLLADEMGLGKTCQSICFLEHVLSLAAIRTDGPVHALVVVQKTVVENWRREFAAWAPHLNVIGFTGSRADREMILAYEKHLCDVERGRQLGRSAIREMKRHLKPDVVIVTYESIRTPEFHQFAGVSFEWTVMVVDECQKAKGGRGSTLLYNLARVRRLTTLLLSGTPIQNTTDELFPLLTLVHPERFSYDNNKAEWTERRFVEEFGNMQEQEDCVEKARQLQLLMAPYVLRREKEQVLRRLPAKRVNLVRIPLTLIQKRAYSALYHHTLKAQGVKWNNVHMLLRKACVHPFLVEGIEDLILSGKITDEASTRPSANVLLQSSEGSDKGSTAPSPEGAASSSADTVSSTVPAVQELAGENRYNELLLRSSGKFVLLEKMLLRMRDENRKVLVFSFFKGALDLVNELTDKYKWVVERVDGESTLEERQLAIDRFNSDPKRFVFLCTTRAGGLGINLTSASVVIHMDSDFNPQHDLQAQARCHRIGQTREVEIFHLIAEHTYEDYVVFNIAGKKLGLEAVLLGRVDQYRAAARRNNKKTKQEEEDFLRKGVYVALRDDKVTEDEARQFAEASFDDILLKRTTKVEVNPDSSAGSERDDSSPGDVTSNSSPVRSSAESCANNIAFARADLAIEASGGLSNEDDLIKGLDPNEELFWEKVAERLGPWTLAVEETAQAEEEAAAAMADGHIRGSRRKRKLDALAAEKRRRLSDVESIGSSSGGSDKREDGEERGRAPGRRDEDEDDGQDSYVGSSSNSSESSDDEEGESGEGRLTRDELNMSSSGDEATKRRRKRLSSSSRKRKRHQRSPSLDGQLLEEGLAQLKQKEEAAASNRVSQFYQRAARLAKPGGSSLLGSLPDRVSPTLLSDELIHRKFGGFQVDGPVMAGGYVTDSWCFLMLSDLTYRCLRCSETWKSTLLYEAHGLRSEDVREADRTLPWGRATAPLSVRKTLESLKVENREGGGAPVVKMSKDSRPRVDRTLKILVDSWQTMFQDWITAGEEFAEIHRTFCRRDPQKIMEEEEPRLRLAHQSGGGDSNKKSFEEWAAEEVPKIAAKRASCLLEDVIREALSKLAQTVLVGKGFSRDMMSKKQTWIGVEDLVIKMVWIHCIGTSGATPTTEMTWPPPQQEIDWDILTLVLTAINKLIDGPERRRDAVMNRFYNKLDCRWSNEDFSPAELEILTKAAIENWVPAKAVPLLPGRTLDRVRRGIKIVQARMLAGSDNDDTKDGRIGAMMSSSRNNNKESDDEAMTSEVLLPSSMSPSPVIDDPQQQRKISVREKITALLSPQGLQLLSRVTDEELVGKLLHELLRACEGDPELKLMLHNSHLGASISSRKQKDMMAAATSTTSSSSSSNNTGGSNRDSETTRSSSSGLNLEAEALSHVQSIVKQKEAAAAAAGTSIVSSK